MKKVIASDYDGTICIDGRVSDETKLELTKWRKAGNYFGLVTGRDIRLAKLAIEENALHVDFLICNNGTVIYDKKYNIIKATTLPIDLVCDIIKNPILKRSIHIELSNNNGRYIYDDNFCPDKYQNTYYTGVLNLDNIKRHSEFYQIDTLYKNSQEMHAVSEELIKIYGKKIKTHPNVVTVDITAPGITKCSGIQEYVKLFSLEACDIITVGDGFNDISMIDNYRGYAMEWADEKIKAKAKRGIVKSLSEIIKKEL